MTTQPYPLEWIIFVSQQNKSDLYDLPIVYYLQNDIQGNLLIFYIFSSLSVISFIGMCSAIKWLPIVSYCGQSSIIILGLHIMFLGQETTPIYWITGLAPTIQQLFPITLFLCWLSIPVFKKYFPYFTAQKNVFDWIEKRKSVSTTSTVAQ